MAKVLSLLLVLLVVCSITAVASAQSLIPALPDSIKAPRTIVLTGTVSDEENHPLAGVTVKLHGGQVPQLCITNGREAFLFDVPTTGGTITVSFVGYQTQEYSFAKVTALDVVLQPEPGYVRDRKTRQLYRRFNKSASKP